MRSWHLYAVMNADIIVRVNNNDMLMANNFQLKARKKMLIVAKIVFSRSYHLHTLHRDARNSYFFRLLFKLIIHLTLECKNKQYNTLAAYLDISQVW